MKTYLLAACCVFSGISIVAAEPTAAAPPSPVMIGNTAEQLWRASKFAELEKYLTILAKKYPKRVVSHVAMGFVEQVLHQDAAATAAQLKPVADALEAGTMTAESKFILQVVGTWFSSSNDASDLGSAALNERLKRNPDVAGQRAFYGAKLPPMLEIIKSSPDIDAPR